MKLTKKQRKQLEERVREQLKKTLTEAPWYVWEPDPGTIGDAVSNEIGSWFHAKREDEDLENGEALDSDSPSLQRESKSKMKVTRADLMRILREELTQHLTEAPWNPDAPTGPEPGTTMGDDPSPTAEPKESDLEADFDLSDAEMDAALDMDTDPTLTENGKDSTPWYIWSGGEYSGEQEDFDVGDHIARWMFGEGVNIDSLVDALNEVDIPGFYPDPPHKQMRKQAQQGQQEQSEEPLAEGETTDTIMAHGLDFLTPFSSTDYSQGIKAHYAQEKSQEPKLKTKVNRRSQLADIEANSQEAEDSANQPVNERFGLGRRLAQRKAQRAVGDYTEGPIGVESSTEQVMTPTGVTATDTIRTSNRAGTTNITTTRRPGREDEESATITNPEGIVTGERRPGLDFDLDAEDAAGSGERDWQTGGTTVGATYTESKQLQKESQDPFKRMRQLALKPYGSYRDED